MRQHVRALGLIGRVIERRSMFLHMDVTVEVIPVKRDMRQYESHYRNIFRKNGNNTGGSCPMAP